MKRKNYKATSPSISDSKSVILNNYNQQELETPVLVGHILFQMKEKVSQYKIMSWVQTSNNKNGFYPEINYSIILRMAILFKTIDDLDCEELKKLCTEPLHMKMPTKCQGKATISTTETITMTSTRIQTSLPSQHCNGHKEKIVRLNQKIKRLNDTIADLKSTLNRKDKLIRKKNKIIKSRNLKELSSKNLNKLSSRKVHYICRLNNIMNKNIPPLVESLFKYLDIDGKVYQRTCVNKMPTELGFISDYITADAVLKSDNATLVFDATTQDGVHFNNLMITTPTTSFVVSIEHLSGGTAQDYYLHITKSIDRLAEVYSIVTLNPFRNKNKIKIKNCCMFN